ncbi:NHLP family bacteriocin export ABC transporter peptidase/permease/ATPase subunit [Chlorobium phaeovibrioides]|uniref:NHLP family bacteriocin export ABC transporter peptidase/permease/ATPase subunit n=1 Tax=Chlorobium phaeovibrioides TaxID=1094 RepID=A0ABW9US13_CHLPH|nr:NHLP family bacteriocin export ABC transporter peptidase/permease/ATPase subunit [Chlorobium phaeovibrioides]MWV55052.1 NHLP family bacteriocin export ABC transporter peptidase/permease/ATPase subunit [Chlorobium phaeovibrioides]
MSFMLFPTKILWEEDRIKTPTVLQMEAVECGAASLGMILAYFGKYVPLEELRVECGVSRDGSKSSSLLAAGKRYGLESKGARLDIDDLHRKPLPMILFWNMYHFVVFEGYRKGIYYINDPASGQRKVSAQEFSESYSGVALTFEKTDAFQPGGRPFSLAGALKKRMPGLERALTYIVLASLLLVIPGLVVPSFLRIFIDYVLVQGATDWLRPLLIGMLLTALLQGVLTWLKQYYLLRAETKLALTSSAKFFNHVFAMPMRFFTMRQAGEISNRVQLNDQVATLVAGDLTANALNFLLIAFYALLMFRYDTVLTFGAILIAAVNAAALFYVSRKRVVLNQKFQQDSGKLMGTTFYGIKTIESLKASGSEPDFFARWSGLFANMVNGQQQLQVATVFLLALPPFLQSFGNIAILSVGGLRVMEGQLSMGMLIAFQSLLMSFLAPVNEMVTLGQKLQDAEGNMQRLDDVMDNDVELETDEDDDEEHQPLEGHIELRDITFGYNVLEAPLIENFSLKLEPGQRVALVGGSGSGKSTVSKLVAGLYEPWSGELLFDGIPRRELPRKRVAASVGMVDQEISLFEGSIAENISMWDGTMPQEEIERAARDAAIDEVISSRTGGYQANLSEGGANFSGGQRQRIEIARALATNPSILILDEATSALDPTTEKRIDENIRKRGCTCLIVAHRLSTIRDCDEIIVLEYGKVKERGTHQSLMALGGVYAGLIKTG